MTTTHRPRTDTVYAVVATTPHGSFIVSQYEFEEDAVGHVNYFAATTDDADVTYWYAPVQGPPVRQEAG